MTKVLVVCKTRMQTGLCLGGITQRAYDRIRLLTPDGYNQPVDTPFNVGDIWECQLVHRPPLRQPHTEDMLVLRQDFIQRVTNMREFLMPRIQPKPAHQSALFDGLLAYTESGSAYVSERTGLPDHAHEFWLTVEALRLRRDGRKLYYEPEASSSSRLRLPYVGLEEPVEWLPAGSLLHLSLARWWLRPGANEERCYLQLSGFFK